jgi:hypothetical protein
MLGRVMAMGELGEWIVFVDESGDHSLMTIDPEYPVFVLAFTIFRKDALARTIGPLVQTFKFTHFGHDTVILHERDIRKETGAFKKLFHREYRARFLGELSSIIEGAEFHIVAVVIRKNSLIDRYKYPDNPYHLGLRFGLERVSAFLASKSSDKAMTHVIVERRGQREDEGLELEFKRLMTDWQGVPFELVMANKHCNSIGLQLSDLVARPIGRHVINPRQGNKAWEIIERKLVCGGNGYHGVGLKVFP